MSDKVRWGNHTRSDDEWYTSPKLAKEFIDVHWKYIKKFKKIICPCDSEESYIYRELKSRGWVMTQDTGGGSDLYMHEVGITDGDWQLQIAFLSTSPTKLSITDILRTKLNSAFKGVGSKFVDTSTTGIAINAYYYNYTNQDAVGIDYIDLTQNPIKYYSNLRIPVSRWSLKSPNSEYPSGGYIITKIS